MSLQPWPSGTQQKKPADPRTILRIDDTDLTRCKPEFEAQILEDLAWLGFEWQAGIRRQSEHFDDYQTALQTLEDRGLTYRCFRTRKEIAAAGGEAFRGAALPEELETEHLNEGRPYAIRLSLDRARDLLGDTYDRLHYFEQKQGETRVIPADPTATGDIILRRKDSPASYHLASTRDDAATHISHIVRGEDLLGAAPVHALLQALMDWPETDLHSPPHIARP